MCPERILVTGGAGFIGSHLVERLLAEGHAVTVLDDLSTGSLDNLRGVRSEPRLDVIESKVSECANLGRLIAGTRHIYHLAATVGVELVLRSPLQTLRTNVRETEVLLEAASDARVPLLLTSTSEVYGNSLKVPFGEDDGLLIGPPGQSRWSYACSKLLDEFLALAYWKERHLPVVVVRLFNTVGPRQSARYGMVLPRFIAAAQVDHPLRVYGDGTQTRCFSYVADVVDALVRLQGLRAAAGEVFNVGSTDEVSIRELASVVTRTLRSRSCIEYVPYDEAYPPGFEEMRRRKPRVDKLTAMIHSRPRTSLVRIIELTAAHLRAQRSAGMPSCRGGVDDELVSAMVRSA